MTTIAFDGKQLVVDSMSSADHLRISRTCQKMWLSVGTFRCVAMAGQVSHYAPIIKWLEDGAIPEAWGDWDAVAWAITADKQVLRYTGGYPEIVNKKDADGSGAEIAMGAMGAGATAVQALAIAIEFDLFTGGELSVFDIKKSKLVH
jgi:hypothetical protein